MSGTKGDPQQGEESPGFGTFVPSSAAGESLPDAKPLYYEFPGPSSR